MWARFDDLRAGTAIGFTAPRRIVSAARPGEVAAVFDEVERATDAGAWAVGFVAYEAAAGLNHHQAVHDVPPDGLPLVSFGLCDAPVEVPSLEAPPAGPAGSAGGAERPRYSAHWEQAWSSHEYREQVEHVRDLIAAGETYQCNLTVRMRGRVEGEISELYRDLALTQRGSYNSYLDLGRYVIASASPELFFERRGEDILLRPMKGTARRGRDLREDRARALALRSSSKEQAENVMIVDLMRNDVGRVSEVGTVRVPALLRAERYETVLQLTSDVEATLRPGTRLVELFRALFPCGSITGAPKVRTMELIRELEPTPRGVYCGAIGFVAPPQAAVRARFNVAIRTVVVDRSTGEAIYGTGGGITWSSDAAEEHDELLAKTAVLHRRHQDFELLETMLQEQGGAFRNRDLHLERLAESAEHLGFAFDRARALAALAALPSGAGRCRVRVRLRRDGKVAVDVNAPPEPDAGPCRVAIDDDPVDSGQWWLFHKTSLREPYDRRRMRRPDLDDVVMVNERGEITEATTAAVAVRLDGHWYTPPIESGCLPGVERRRLLEAGSLRERVLQVSDLDRAEGIALVNSLRGWRPACLVG